MDIIRMLQDDQLRILVQNFKKLCDYVRISSFGRNIEEVANKACLKLHLTDHQGAATEKTDPLGELCLPVDI